MTTLSTETEITPFPIIKFYGISRKRKSKIEDPANAKGILKKQSWKVPKAYESRILGPTYCWKIFHRQRDAFQFAQKTSEDVHVFAYEFSEGSNADNPGQRRYLVTSLPVFWHYYSQLELCRRHHYEVIPEGKPCKLYFDLEYLREYNLDKDGDKMVDTLIQVVCLWLKKLYNRDCKRSHVLDLDSSTETKFSRHLIFQMENALFENCVTAGAFVRHIFHQLVDVIKIKSTLQKDPPSDRPAPATAGTDLCKSHLSKHLKNKKNVSDLGGLSWDKDHITDEDKQLSLVAEMCEQRLTGCAHDDSAPSTCTSSNLQRVNHEREKESRATTLNVFDVIQRTNTAVEARGSGYSDYETYNHEIEVSYGSNERHSGMRGEGAEVFGQFAWEDLSSLLVKNKDGNETLFCDLGVYTKNRNFRMFMSSKLNKNNPLVVSSRNQFLPDLNSKNKKSQEELFFYSSLISQTQSESSNVEALQMETSKSYHKIPWLNSVPNEGGAVKGDEFSVNDFSLEGSLSTSPYPEIDGFVQNLVTNRGRHGMVRHWTYFTTREILIYDIAGYRWCGNVQREHRSNNIMYVVDLRKGVYYQKCYDPDCQAVGYKSESLDVPYHLLPASFFEDLDTGEELFDSDNEDAQLVAAVSEIETELTDASSHTNDKQLPSFITNLSHHHQQTNTWHNHFDSPDDDILLEAVRKVETSCQ
ncbi:unnamed protein product [Lymnaea stagnalis]|uniref:DNA-directed primase/polymerase protein n=1 Tax=Lymnaea stagnalis TaxID=6523 RepID=A0AAV2HKE3_LYMST